MYVGTDTIMDNFNHNKQRKKQLHVRIVNMLLRIVITWSLDKKILLSCSDNNKNMTRYNIKSTTATLSIVISLLTSRLLLHKLNNSREPQYKMYMILLRLQ